MKEGLLRRYRDGFQSCEIVMRGHFATITLHKNWEVAHLKALLRKKMTCQQFL
jgi:hypothetical protein